MKARYEGNFSNRADVFQEFAVLAELRKGVRILFAAYFYEEYSGSAYVLFRKGKKLYEVHGGHCSCNGLEEQWTPEETTIEAVRKLIAANYFGQTWTGTEKNNGYENLFAEQLADQLDRIEQAQNKRKIRKPKKNARR